MRLLLDTHTLLWFLANDGRMSRTAKAAIEDTANERWLSPISLLEIAIKVRIGKLTLPAPFAVMFPADLLTADIHRCRLKPSTSSRSQRFRSTTRTRSTASSPQPRWSRA